MHGFNNLTTLSHRYNVARALAGADTQIDLTTAGDFASMPSTGVLDIFKKDVVTPQNAAVFPETAVNGICFIFAATAAADKDMNWRLLSWRNENGPTEIVANGTSTTGTQAVVTWPHNGEAAANAFWCDTIVVSNEYWMKEIEATAAGGNSVSKLFLDACGYRYWKMEITLPGLGNDITNAAVFWGYF